MVTVNLGNKEQTELECFLVITNKFLAHGHFLSLALCSNLQCQLQRHFHSKPYNASSNQTMAAIEHD